jgi:hypothetical protein
MTTASAAKDDQITAADTGTDVFTNTSHGFIDNQEVYTYCKAGVTYSALHNKIWIMDSINSDTFKLKYTNGSYFDASLVYTSGDCRIQDADVNGLSYGHNMYSNSYGAIVDGMQCYGGRHCVSNDDRGGTKSDDTAYLFGLPTGCVVRNVVSFGGQGPVTDWHHSASGCDSEYSTAYNMLRGDGLGTYEGLGAQMRGYNNTLRNFTMSGGAKGVRQPGNISNYKPTTNFVYDLNVKNLESALSADYCLAAEDQAGGTINALTELSVSGSVRCEDMNKVIHFEDFGKITAGGAQLEVVNPGARVFDMESAPGAWGEFGNVTVTYPLTGGNTSSASYLTDIESGSSGVYLKLGNVKINLNSGSTNRPFTTLSEVSLSAGGMAWYGIDSLKIQNNTQRTTIPRLFDAEDLWSLQFLNYGPDIIELSASGTVTTGTLKDWRQMRCNFQPVRFYATVGTVSSSGSTIIDINKGSTVGGLTSVFGTTKLSIDQSVYSSLSATYAPDYIAGGGNTFNVIPEGHYVSFDVDTAGGSAANLRVYLQGYCLN